jgi:hypothetical protein
LPTESKPIGVQARSLALRPARPARLDLRAGRLLLGAAAFFAGTWLLRIAVIGARVDPVAGGPAGLAAGTADRPTGPKPGRGGPRPAAPDVSNPMIS